MYDIYTYIVKPGDPGVGRLGLHPAVEVDITTLVYSVRRDVLTKTNLNMRSI